MRVAYNKMVVDSKTEKIIRSMFFKQIEMKDIEKVVGLRQHIIRRVINEHKWSNKRERYLKYLVSYSYAHDIPLINMSEITGVKYYVLCRIHRKYRIPKPQKFAWNDRRSAKIEESIIKDYRMGLSGDEVAKKNGYQRAESVYQILEKHKVIRKPSKRYTYYDESFFEKIDGPDKAYTLGLIMTDGYIIKDYDGFGIQLTENDGYILKKIRDRIGGTNPITHIDCSTKREFLPNARDMSRLHVFSKKIAKDLKLLGVVKNKSKTIRYNNCVPNEYLSHFFRGLIDGDGTVGTHSKNGNIWCQITSASKKFIEDLYLVKTPFKFSINKSETKCKNNKICKMYVLRICGGNKSTIEFLKWLYNNKEEFYLRRKYEKVQNYIN